MGSFTDFDLGFKFFLEELAKLFFNTGSAFGGGSAGSSDS